MLHLYMHPIDGRPPPGPAALLRIDANLLVALDVFLDERSVSGAARRLGLTQPAASHTLARLRAALGDPLLVRTGSGMSPTPRAVALAGPLRAALHALAAAVAEPAPFAPATAALTVRLAVLDLFATTLVPALVADLAAAGPGLSLDVVALDLSRGWDQLRRGEADVALVGPWAPPDDIVMERLFEEHLRALVRADHPLLAGGAPLTAAGYAAWPHVVFRISGEGAHPVDEALAALGLRRRRAARLPFFQSAAAIAAETDHIVNLPASVAAALVAAHPGLASFLPPLPAPVRYPVSLAWPRVLDAEPAQVWFRALVRRRALALAPPPAPAGPGAAALPRAGQEGGVAGETLVSPAPRPRRTGRGGGPGVG
jgi:DNA-binding transcriptional LysR family regulator